uniref:GCR089 n=1 Tax=Schmidtea mediterranea TaxID=79327 RepID=A0A193KUQ9_SCHMD|nr:GCR089 [Schmidtea mediterranea]
MNFSFIVQTFNDSFGFFIFRILFICSGIFVNGILLSFLFINRIGSVSSNILVRLQTIVDILSLISVIFAMFSHQEAIWIDNLVIYQIYCRIFHTNYLFWFSMVFRGYILFATSIDRLIVVVYPLKYRDIRMSRYRICIVLAFILSFFLVLPVLWETTVVGNIAYNFSTQPLILKYKCYFEWESPAFSLFWKVYSYIWLIFSYFLPASVMIGIYLKIITELNSSKHTFNVQSMLIKRNLSIKFTISSIIIFAFYIVTYSVDCVIFVLNMMELLTFYDASKYYYYCNFLLGTNAMINPYVYLVLIKNFRKYVRKLVLCGQGNYKEELSKTKSGYCASLNIFSD